MKINTRFVFNSTHKAWNQVLAFQRRHISSISPKLQGYKRVLKSFKNTAVKIATYMGLATATLFVGGGDLLIAPARYFILCRRLTKGLQEDLNRLNPEQKAALRAEISEYIKRKNLSGKKDNELITTAMACHARSKEFYAPVALEWVTSLLSMANRENKKLVFMARDGSAPYKLSKKLLENSEYREKYPNMVGDDKIVLGYFSRKIINNAMSSDENREIFRDYARNELGIAENEACMFVDIGFEGSMISKIRSLLPKNAIEFHYLISLTSNAYGFLASKQHQLQSVSSAGSNLGIHWLEDSHQGTINSATKLVRVGDRVYPDTKIPGKKKTCLSNYTNDDKSKVKGAKRREYVLRKWSKRAVVRAAEYYQNDSTKYNEYRERFNEVLKRIKNGQLPLIINHV